MSAETALLIAGLVAIVVALRWVTRNTEGGRAYIHARDGGDIYFQQGYLAALRSYDRTGMHPLPDPDDPEDFRRKRIANGEFERIYIKRVPPETKAQRDARVDEFLRRPRIEFPEDRPSEKTAAPMAHEPRDGAV